MFLDNTNLLEGLGEDNDSTSTLKKGEQSVNSWGGNLLAVGGELRPDMCSYIVYSTKPTKDGEWEYVQEKLAKVANVANVEEAELDNL